MFSTDDLLAERGKTHGDFGEHANITQSLKRVMHSARKWDELSDAQKEAAEMIAHKLGRILAGDPNLPDHWDDTAGYARLVSQRLAPCSAPTSVYPNFSPIESAIASAFADDDVAAMAARLAPASR